LLRFAILLFPLDVGIRRVQLDRAEWLKATENLRRWLFFWKGKPRPVEADESLGALLARKEQVRQKTNVPVVEVNPELFRPSNPVESGTPFVSSGGGTSSRPAAVQEAPVEQEPERKPADMASRLLEAKKRAQRKQGGGE
jgi:hypothetical protein